MVGVIKINTQRLDLEGNLIFLNDIVLVKDFNGNNNGYIDVGIVKYSNASCSFYIQCKYPAIDFTPFLYLKILDKVENHKDKTDLGILELYQDEWKKYK